MRAEDFLVLATLLIWLIYFVRRKITLKTPLTIPIFIFWIVGAFATIHGVLLIFPNISDVFPNVALLSYIRRVEYMSLFFVAYAGMRDKEFLKYVIATLVVTLLAIIGYGFGQKYMGFSAFLTMNEEFAKGVPIQLSELSRVPSTFAGHYDLAAYLVLVIPILASLLFGIKNWIVRIILGGSILLGIVLMFMTVSRVSFFVLILSLLIVIFMYKRKLILYTLPILAVLAFVFLSSSTTLMQRFTNTVKDVDVLVNAETGAAIGNPQLVNPEYLEGKVVKTSVTESSEGVMSLANPQIADPASASGRFALESLPDNLFLISASNVSTGETLPQGTGYINLSLSPVTKKVHEFLYEKKLEGNATASAEVYIVYGDFVVKRASAYDLSFTTRFQGGWPRALDSFMRNVFLGSGYGSVSLAVDNNYLRLLGEIGILGTVAFLGVFVTMGVFIKKALVQVDSPLARSFALGFMAGVVGVCLNAVLIDVFEASKVAFTLWLLSGVTLGVLSLYQTKKVDLLSAVKEALSSSYAVIVYIALATVLIYSPMLDNYFVGDDYTWFRWAVDCTKGTVGAACPPVLAQVTDYFTNADGFFYRPGTKAYFLFMYSTIWLNQAVYHLVSLSLHFIVAVFVFLLAKRVFKSTLYGGISVLFFLILSGYAENVFWISATGHLFNAVFVLASIFLFALWQERKNVLYFILAFISVLVSMLFHELGVIAPLLIVLYAYFLGYLPPWRNLYKQLSYPLIFLTIPLYLLARFAAGSHWFQGDYNYNILKFPLNAVGNSIGYALLSIFGPIVLPFYNMLRAQFRDNLAISVVFLAVLLTVLYFGYKMFRHKVSSRDKKIIIFGFLFFLISLLPFIGFGNITSRYSYLASVGIVLILVLGFEKIYNYLLETSGKSIALFSVVTIASMFYLFHVIQIQGLHSDWYEAGEKSRKFFISLDQKYVDYWSREPMELHFVDTPLKVGEAWVFPVGLSDALWLVYRNPQLQVFQDVSVQSALDQVDNPLTDKVFVFDDTGLTEVIKKRLPE